MNDKIWGRYAIRVDQLGLHIKLLLLQFTIRVTV